MSISTGQMVARSVTGTIYETTKEYLVVTPEDVGVKAAAKLGASAVFYPLLALVALVECVVRIPLALIGKAVIFFIPRDQQEDSQNQATFTLATRAECCLVAGPGMAVRFGMTAIKRLCQQFGKDEAANSIAEARDRFCELYEKSVDKFLCARVNTICSANS